MFRNESNFSHNYQASLEFEQECKKWFDNSWISRTQSESEEKEDENILYFIKSPNENENSKTSSNISNDNIQEKLAKSENIKEFIEINNKNRHLLFKTKKKGRPKNNQKNKVIKSHNKNSLDNASKKIFNSCKINIYNFITEFVNVKLHIPTIEKQLGYSYQNYNKFINKSIYDIFCDSSPKRLKNEIKNNRDNYNYNNVEINKLLEEEKNNPKKTTKIFNDLFKLSFGVFLKAYLNDEKEIKIFDEKIDLIGFNTFGECFNIGKNKYSQKQKNRYKNHIFDIIENKKRNRKARSSGR